MIRSFGDAATEDVFEALNTKAARRLPFETFGRLSVGGWTTDYLTRRHGWTS